jgi:hypothetical protein
VLGSNVDSNRICQFVYLLRVHEDRLKAPYASQFIGQVQPLLKFVVSSVGRTSIAITHIEAWAKLRLGLRSFVVACHPIPPIICHRFAGRLKLSQREYHGSLTPCYAVWIGFTREPYLTSLPRILDHGNSPMSTTQRERT